MSQPQFYSHASGIEEILSKLNLPTQSRQTLDKEFFLLKALGSQGENGLVVLAMRRPEPPPQHKTHIDSALYVVKIMNCEDPQTSANPGIAASLKEMAEQKMVDECDTLRRLAALTDPETELIASLAGCDSSSPCYWLATDYIHGVSLEQLIQIYKKKGKTIPFSFIYDIFLQGFNFLAWLREETGSKPFAVWHNDLYPRNWMLDFSHCSQAIPSDVEEIRSSYQQYMPKLILIDFGEASFKDIQIVKNRDPSEFVVTVIKKLASVNFAVDSDLDADSDADSQDSSTANPEYDDLCTWIRQIDDETDPNLNNPPTRAAASLLQRGPLAKHKFAATLNIADLVELYEVSKKAAEEVPSQEQILEIYESQSKSATGQTQQDFLTPQNPALDIQTNIRKALPSPHKRRASDSSEDLSIAPKVQKKAKGNGVGKVS
ncbi:hypothetical protein EJ08DRAFT_647133 [Tothia fuscella]|uniref:Protein kinase domain-containing protein n=1 Tax=Tothia fuscella TaxID=1048955 RepID=A0A9P4NYZ8_9PEZI|nr:hypothetical protein EJ08DRAFT_647133 [Tothia fuscella]